MCHLKTSQCVLRDLGLKPCFKNYLARRLYFKAHVGSEMLFALINIKSRGRPKQGFPNVGFIGLIRQPLFGTVSAPSLLFQTSHERVFSPIPLSSGPLFCIDGHCG